MEDTERIKFTTTLAKDVIYKLGKMAPDIVVEKKRPDLNDVIEYLVRKAWRESNHEMDKENGDIG